jgi:CubicO group peptidase (beta-lactamase class C family)
MESLFTPRDTAIEKVTGQDWEFYVEEKILTPLGMGSTTFSIEGLNGSKDFAAPYILEEATSRRIPYHDIRHVGPAETINSNLLDLYSNYFKICFWATRKLSEFVDLK